MLKIEADDAPLFTQIDPILKSHALVPAAYEQRDQMLILRLQESAIASLVSNELRSSLISKLEALDLRYIALDLTPLRT